MEQFLVARGQAQSRELDEPKRHEVCGARLLTQEEAAVR